MNVRGAETSVGTDLKQTRAELSIERRSRSSHPPSIRRQLIVLTATLVFPAAIAGTVLLAYTYAKDRAVAARQLQTTARALSIVVDRQLGEASAMAQALATSPALIAGDFATFDRQARLTEMNKGEWIVVRDAAGRQRVNTRLPEGAALPDQPADIVSHRDLLNHGRYITNLVLDSSPAGPRVSVDVPVLRDGEFVGEIDIGLKPQTFDVIFREQQLPEQWIGVIVDRNGLIVRRSRAVDQTVGHPVSPSFQEQLAKPLSAGLFEGTSLEGESTLVAFSRSPVSGWTFSVAVPRDAIGAAARRSLHIAIAAGFVLIGFGGLLGRRIARGITGPVETLAARAVALGKGERGDSARTGLAETDLVADALCEAAEKIHGFTTMLEQKVEERTRDLADANRQLSTEIYERNRAEQQLAQIQRLEAVGQLSGGIAHDFNNLLQAIVGNIDLVKLRTADDKAKTYLDHALSAADRGAKLTGQLLAFARKQRLSPVAVDVRALVGGIVEILRSTIDRTITIETELADPLWPALSDPTQLELIVVNLAINARDAMPDGGRIAIAATNVVRPEPTRPEDPPAGDFVELVVRDTGIGIRPEVLGKVFEPFFTTKGVGKGTGLGLSQVLGLAQQLGGGVVIESEIGVGTAVKVYLARAG
jgi:signal transduction histidine kinase